MTPTAAFLPDTAIAAAQQLAGIVHGDGGQPEVAALLETMDRHGLYALAVTLAAMVDVDRSPEELLGWTTEEPGELWRRRMHTRYARGERDEDTVAGERAYQAERSRRRRTVGRTSTTAATTPVLDELLIEQACRGERVRLSTPERIAAVHRLCSDLRPPQIAYRLNMSTARVQQILRESTLASTRSGCGHDGGPCQAGAAPSDQTNRREAS